MISPSENAEIFEILLVGATGGAVLGSQLVARVTIGKSDSPSGVVRFLNESLITVVNPNSTLKLNVVLERAGGLVGNATVWGTISSARIENHISSLSNGYLQFTPRSFSLRTSTYSNWICLLTGCLDHPWP